jgi:hypothetical protein
MADRYLEPHQSRTGPPTEFEDRLGDAIEAAYAAGIHDLDGLVVHLDRSGPAAPGGGAWTIDGFTALMAELGR